MSHAGSALLAEAADKLGLTGAVAGAGGRCASGAAAMIPAGSSAIWR